MPDITKLNLGTDTYDIKDAGAKRLQNAVSGPASTSGTTTAFVDSITQNAEGVISYTTKTISAEIPGTAEMAQKLTPGAKIDGVNFDGSAGIVHYAATTATSGVISVVVPGYGSTLTAGARLILHQTEGNYVGTTTAQINIKSSASDTTGTGAKNIKYKNGNLLGWAAGKVLELVYDGTEWEYIGDINTDTTYTFNGTYSASTNPAATVATVTNAINALDCTEVDLAANETVDKISQTNGVLSVTKQSIGSLNASAITAGTLPIARGGTNATSYTSNDVVYYNGTSFASAGTDKTHLNYLNNVTSDIQGQIDAITGGGTDHIRFLKVALTYNGTATTSTAAVAGGFPASNVMGGYTVAVGDVVIDTNGVIGKVTATGSNGAASYLGYIGVGHTYNSGVTTLTIGPACLVPAASA